MQNFIKFYGETIRGQNALYTSTGEGKQAFVDARDIAAVAVEALTGDGHEGKIYSVTGPEAISHDQVAEILSGMLGRKISHVNISEEQSRIGMKEAGSPDWLIEGLIEADRTIREGHFSIVSPTVKDVTGRKPRSFEQFTRDYTDAFK